MWVNFIFHVNLYLRLVQIHWRGQIQYRVSLLMDLVNAALVTLLEYASLSLVLTRFGSLQGWLMPEVALLYGLVEIAFGFMDMVFDGFDPQRFGFQVRRGTFDQLMLRPVNLIVQVLGSGLALRRSGKIFIGGAILAYGIKFSTIAWTPFKVFYLPWLILALVCFFGGLFIFGAGITFWTIDSIEMVNIFTYGTSYAISHPMHIYPDWIRRFLTYILPAIFLTYYPVLYLLGKPDPFHLPAYAPFLSPIVGLGILAASIGFFRFGVNHYQSAGS